MSSELRGHLDSVHRDGLRGWVQDLNEPDRPVRLIIKIDGEVLQRLTADVFRQDLQDANIGSGAHSFAVEFYPALSPQRHVIEVLCEHDGLPMRGSPIVLEAEADASVPIVTTPEVIVPAAVPEDALKVASSGLIGHLDKVERNSIQGWVMNPDEPDRPVSLLITANGKLIARVMANRYRADLEAAGIADGRRSFDVAVTELLSPLTRQVIEIRREEDGAHLPGSPFAIEAEAAFDGETREWISRLLTDADNDAAIRDRLMFLSQQMEALLQNRADLRAHRLERQREQKTDLRWNGGNSSAAPQKSTRAPGSLRALVIDERMPVRNRDAGSNAMRSHLQSLRRLGFEVSFAAAEMAPEAMADLEAMGIAHCGPPWYTSVEEVLKRQSGCFDLVYLHRLSMATRYSALVRAHQPRARLIYSVADLHHLRMRRQADAQRRPELIALADRMQVSELIAISSVDGVITHSSHESNLLRRQVPAAKVFVVPWDVPVAATQVPFAQRKGMAFIGHFAHQPNVDAVQWLIDDIVPRLLARDPTFECLLVGTQLPEALRKPRPGIVPIGEVENISEIFNRVRLTVAPLTYGAGIKGKLLDSLAAGVPCAGTSIASEGLDLPAELMNYICDNAGALVTAIESLHGDVARNRAAAESGLAYVRERLSEARIDALMREALRLPVQPKPMEARA